MTAKNFLSRNLLRCWAVSLSLAMAGDQGMQWPGFSYTSDEKKTLTAALSDVTRKEFLLFLLLVPIFFILVAGTFSLGTIWLLIQIDPAHQAETLTYAALGAMLLLSFSVGFPFSMIASSLILSRFYPPPTQDPPDLEERYKLARKVLWQFLRIGAVVAILATLFAAFVPLETQRSRESGRWVLAGLAALSAVLTALWALLRPHTR